MDTFDYQSRAFRRGRVLYVIEAALEYFISLLVSGAFLARITNELGFSDRLTGIVTAFASVGAVFQILSMFLCRGRVKRFTIVGGILSQLCYVLLYCIPLTSMSVHSKIALAVIAVISACFFANLVMPGRTVWEMSLVENGHRGRFSGKMQIVSLVSGIVFSYVMGYLLDYYNVRGRIRTAFSISALTMLVVASLNLLCRIFIIEPERKEEQKPAGALRDKLRYLKNPNIVRLAVLFTLKSISGSVATAFLGSYMIKEMAFSQTYIVFLTMLSSLSQIVGNVFLGRLIDRRSSMETMKVSFLLAGASYLMCAFATPGNGRIVLLLYYLLTGAANGGLGIASTNMVFEYIDHSQRADAFAVCNSISGVLAFGATIVAGKLVSNIQGSGNLFLGMHVYAQQITALIGMVIALSAILFSRKIAQKNYKKTGKGGCITNE